MTQEPPSDATEPEIVHWQGRFITAKQRGKWEYVGRTRGIRAAAIIPIASDADGRKHIILVQQYRVPLGAFCLEIPAGLVGDESEGEPAEVAARRELEEETGWRAGRMDHLGDFYSSPGMVSESFSLFRATDLEKVGDGGGVDGEDIAVMRVPLDELSDFVEAKRRDGVAIDVKVAMLLAPDFLRD